jgi:hypothetical protein
MEPKGSIPKSQEFSTCFYTEQDQSSPHHPIPTNNLYTSHPSHSPALDYSNYSWRRVQIMKPLVTSFLFRPNVLLSTLFSDTLSLCSSLNDRDQISQPYRTTGKIIILYIGICMFFDSRRENGRFRTEW